MSLWEHTTTHWAIKDGNIPAALMSKLSQSYDVVFSFAGEDRHYVEKLDQGARRQAGVNQNSTGALSH
jgi:hypothetical protein